MCIVLIFGALINLCVCILWKLVKRTKFYDGVSQRRIEIATADFHVDTRTHLLILARAIIVNKHAACQGSYKIILTNRMWWGAFTR